MTPKARRSGFSLLEILLALAILGGSLAILSRIVETGTSAAIESRCLAQARLVCQSKLSEVLLDAASGLDPQTEISVPIASFDSTSTTPMNYSVEVAQGPMDGILIVRVSVAVQTADGIGTLANYSLSRWIVDSSLGLEQAEADEAAALEASAEAMPGEGGAPL
ncbi:prepilin-type N-terminal cleavage/methylation domain-containing protein [Rubripirellula amarantea]|nr:prepilin-type N-terminal cleavage/methylation domain-containing protein [Rubripirellula amarantea]